MCKIGEVVVVGGVRRSAMISLSNLSDDRMRHAKSGQWWENEGQRALANNSVAYTEKPDMETFMREWLALVESKSGERGIFSRDAADKHVERNGRRKTGMAWGTNPCSEIILRPYQFCNLTEVVDTTDRHREDACRESKAGDHSRNNSIYVYTHAILAPCVEKEYRRGKAVGCKPDRYYGQ